MDLMKRSDLVFKDYEWTTMTVDYPFKKELNNLLLSRKEGFEVLNFINEFARKNDLKLIEEGQRAEKMIRHHVPKDIDKPEDIEAWIIDNWSEY